MCIQTGALPNLPTDWMFVWFLFLVADTQLYKRLCPSVGPSVRRSVGPWTWVEKCGNEHFRCFLCMWVGDLGWGWRLDAPAHSSAAILWPRVTCLIFDYSILLIAFSGMCDQHCFPGTVSPYDHKSCAPVTVTQCQIFTHLSVDGYNILNMAHAQHMYMLIA